jgi:hypothetical protein
VKLIVALEAVIVLALPIVGAAGPVVSLITTVGIDVPNAFVAVKNSEYVVLGDSPVAVIVVAG